MLMRPNVASAKGTWSHWGFVMRKDDARDLSSMRGYGPAPDQALEALLAVSRWQRTTPGLLLPEALRLEGIEARATLIRAQVAILKL